jgi:integrase
VASSNQYPIFSQTDRRTTPFKRAQIEKGIREIRPGVFEVQVHANRDPVTGKLRQVSRTTDRGIADARRLRARLIAEVAQGEHGGVGPATFSSLLDEWLDHGEKVGKWAPKTAAEYRRKIDKVIRPALGHFQLKTLSAKHLDALYAARMAEGSAPQTVLQYHRIISAALNQAEKWNYVPRNVARMATPPSASRPTLNAPSPERVRALIEIATASRTPTMATFFAIAAITGMRRGEACGLRWSDIDETTGDLWVRRSFWQLPQGRSGTKLPKNRHERVVKIGSSTIALLREHRARMLADAERAERALVPDAYVFSDDIDGSRPIRPDSVTQAFRRFCNQMERRAATANPPRVETWPYRLHDLRHYTATELFRAGHNPRTVAERLGHLDGGKLALEIYAHDTADQAIAAADSLETSLGLRR